MRANREALGATLSFIAEQLRLVSADQVLQRRGLDSARDMERLAQDEQHGGGGYPIV